MNLFNFLQDKATEKGCKLLRAKDSNGCAKTGYVVWNRDGLWLRRNTQKDVWNWLKLQPHAKNKVTA